MAQTESLDSAPVPLPGRRTSKLVQVRRQLSRSLIGRMYVDASMFASRLRIAQPERYGVEVIRDVPYLQSGMREHLLDVYRPIGATADATRPLVFYVHGGGFYSLSKDTHWILALAFARRGLVVAVPNYRLAPTHRFPAHLEDTAEALRFSMNHAREWGADPEHVIFAGESAGANLITSMAMCLAYDRTEPYARIIQDTGVSPRMVMAACGVFEVTNGARFSERFPGLNWFFEDRYRELEEIYAPHVDGVPQGHDLMNPLLLVEREAPKRPLPPFFLPVGGWDHLKDDHARLAAALKAHGADVEAPVYEKELHAFHAFVLSKRAQKCWDDHFRFMHARGTPVDLDPKTKVGWGIR